MGWQVIGPFLVDENAPSSVKTDVQAVVNRLPVPMRSPAGGYVIIDTGPRPNAAPSWAHGWNVANNKFWIDKRRNSADRQYTIAHEYWHEWSRTRPSIENQVSQLVQGPRGNTETKNWTNDPHEGEADAFAKALGLKSPFPKYEFRAYIPASSYSYFISILNNAPTGTGTPPAIPPSGTPAGNYVNNNAKALWDWMLNNGIVISHYTYWRDFVDAATANDPNMGAYAASVLKTLNISLDSPVNPNTNAAFTTYIANQISLPTPGGANDPIWGGLKTILDPITQSVSHGFFFLVFIIIGLVILVVGFKARPAKTSGASE